MAVSAKPWLHKFLKGQDCEMTMEAQSDSTWILMHQFTFTLTSSFSTLKHLDPTTLSNNHRTLIEEDLVMCLKDPEDKEFEIAKKEECLAHQDMPVEDLNSKKAPSKQKQQQTPHSPGLTSF